MRYETRNFVVPLEEAEGSSFRVTSIRELAVQVSGTFDATLQIMGQAHEGGAWLAVGSPITAPGWYPITHPLFNVRMDTTAYVSGAPVAALAGLNHRGE